jgi:glucokinase
MPTHRPLILAGDIGGTKTNLALFIDGDVTTPVAQASFASGLYPDLSIIVREFLTMHGMKAQRAAFGVAGPVLKGRAKITKLNWLVDREAMAAAFGFEEVVLVNDLVATAHGIAVLPESDLMVLNQGLGIEHGPQVVIAPGTGLGEALMFWDGVRYQIQGTEGGHALFSPATREHLQLANFLFAKYGAVSFDFIASGRGLPLIYSFLQEQGRFAEPPWLAQALAEGDPSPTIAQAALDPAGADPLCLATMRILVEILAVEAANLALKALATGGLFIGGGIPPRIAPIFQQHFMNSFLDQRELNGLLAAMPVHLIMNPHTALLGAARLAMTRCDVNS